MTERGPELHAALLPWFDGVRRDLPWRRTRDPYAIWLSEIMLQQTRVETVIPYYERFLRELPTVSALAEAPSDRVMSLWSGLGYYRRARMLHEAAGQIVRERAGRFPETAATLAEVRGIGRYTAGAIASIAFGERAPLVDGNVARVLSRLFAVREDVRGGPGLARIWELAGALVPERRAGDWNQALMELGATVCTPRAPLCGACPARGLCEAKRRGLEGDLPVLSARTKPVPTRVSALVATSRGKVLLLRRRPEGLFGGLWEPPVVPRKARDVADEGARVAFAALLGREIPEVKFAGSVKHVLSHRRIDARVLVSAGLRPLSPAFDASPDYDAAALVPEGAFAGLGMSTLARKVLTKAGLLRGARPDR